MTTSKSDKRSEKFERLQRINQYIKLIRKSSLETILSFSIFYGILKFFAIFWIFNHNKTTIMTPRVFNSNIFLLIERFLQITYVNFLTVLIKSASNNYFMSMKFEPAIFFEYCDSSVRAIFYVIYRRSVINTVVNV